MGREQSDAGQFEWVNAWAATAIGGHVRDAMKAERSSPQRLLRSAAVPAPSPRHRAALRPRCRTTS